jgi:hypothetical protein
MHMAEIETALDRGNLSVVQSAFCALADYAHGESIEGADDPHKLVHVLDRVIEALRSDRTPMPAETCGAIETVAVTRLLPKASYALGARIVSENREQWRTLFRAHSTDEAS